MHKELRDQMAVILRVIIADERPAREFASLAHDLEN